MAITRLHADVLDAAAEVQRGIESAIVELYGGEVTPETWTSTRQVVQSFSSNLESDTARKLWAEATLPEAAPATTAAGHLLGQRQALLQHVYALEMLDRQQKEQLEPAREWRALIQLPKYADAVQGVLALQHGKGAQRDAVSQLLAREYLVWQTTLIREKTDALQRLIQQKRSTPEMIATRSGEIQTLAVFPAPLLTLVLPDTPPPVPDLASWQVLMASDETNFPLAFEKWSAQIRRDLPNLLTAEDITRRERLLIKLLKLVPVEYSAGVRDGEIVIPIEYREAETFTIQSRQILDELRAPWERQRGDVFTQYEPALRSSIEKLEAAIQAKTDSSVVEREAAKAVEILADQFAISLRRRARRPRSSRRRCWMCAPSSRSRTLPRAQASGPTPNLCGWRPTPPLTWRSSPARCRAIPILPCARRSSSSMVRRPSLASRPLWTPARAPRLAALMRRPSPA